MFYVVHQDFQHLISVEPVRELRPWLVYAFEASSFFPERLPAALKTPAIVEAVAAQVEREYAGSPPPVVDRPIPPEPEPEEEPV
jgi:hypothetical protein